jgi:hypothetical protein
LGKLTHPNSIALESWSTMRRTPDWIQFQGWKITQLKCKEGNSTAMDKDCCAQTKKER